MTQENSFLRYVSLMIHVLHEFRSAEETLRSGGLTIIGYDPYLSNSRKTRIMIPAEFVSAT